VTEKPDPLIGTEIAGRYRVVRRIGRGGMGAIYEVEHTKLGRSFAMKTLTWEVASDAETVARFRREADVIAKLRHPNIVEIVDWDALEDGTPCLVMEYLRGEDLGQRIRARGPLPYDQIARFSDETLAALGVAHRAGIVHRDLKPQNIFLAVDDEGRERVKLLDFGVSKIRGVQSFTTESRLIGTPAYMSPEQAHGSQDEVTPAADVWSMGAILYEMITGKLAFAATSMPSILYRICHEAPDALVDARPDAPAKLVDVIDSALSRDPARRLTDIDTLRALLRKALTGLPNVAYAEPLRSVSAPVMQAVLERAATEVEPGMTTLSSTASQSVPRGSSRDALAAGRARRRFPIVLATIVLAGAAAAAVMVMRPEAEKPAPVVAPNEPPVPPIDTPQAPPIVVPDANVVRHAIDSTPSSAEVYREPNGLHVGRTPVEMRVERATGTVVYILKKPGYEPRRIELPADADHHEVFALYPMNRKPPKPPRPPKPPKERCRKPGEPLNPFDKLPVCK
jgi:serine/threonine-protein kinase